MFFFFYIIKITLTCIMDNTELIFLINLLTQKKILTKFEENSII